MAITSDLACASAGNISISVLNLANVAARAEEIGNFCAVHKLKQGEYYVLTNLIKRR